MRKRSIAIVLIGALVLSNMNVIMAEDFSGRESEMNAKCAAVSDMATLNECKRYKEYLEKKSSNLSDQIAGIKNEVSSIQGDIEKTQAAVDKNNKTIREYDEQIASIQSGIDKIQVNINTLQAQITEKQEEIKERDKLMKNRMLELQAYIGSNRYIDFIMGSTGFADLLRRTEIVAELNTYEQDQIKAVAKEKKELSNKKEIVEEQKDLLEIQKKDIDNKREYAKALNEANKELVLSYQRQQADLNARKIAAEMESASVKASLPTISTTIPPNFGGNDNNGGNNNSDNNDDNNEGNENNSNSGNNNNQGGGDTSGLSSYLMSPLARGTWSYYYGTWSYPGGGIHLGMDFSTGERTRIPVVAPASGIILSTYGGCPEYGGLGNHCGIAWGGNDVLMAVQLANGQSYVLSFYHLYAPTVTAGQIVTQGQQIGLSGSSGNSSGPHCHVEMIYMGTQSLQQIVNTWNANKDYVFGLSWYSTNACGSAPCRVRPENYFL